MVNAQKWLNKNHPNKNITKLDITSYNIGNKGLEGVLDLSQYSKLEVLKCSFNELLNSLNLRGCPQLREIRCMGNNLTELDLSNNLNLEKIDLYSNKLITIPLSPNPQKIISYNISQNQFPIQEPTFLNEMPNLVELNISENAFINVEKYLENCKDLREVMIYNLNTIDRLTVRNLPFLEKVNASSNNLTELQLLNLPNLTEISCYNNNLTSLDFLNKISHPEKLTTLRIDKNRFNSQNLEFLINFTNLEFLDISNNNFYGSLSFLNGLKHLRELRISHTKLESDIELLPTSLETFSIKGVFDIEIKMKDFASEHGGGYNYRGWRIENQEAIQKSKINDYRSQSNNIKRLLISPNYQELEAVERKLNIIYYTQWASRGVIVGSSILSAYGSYCDNHAYPFVGSCLTFPQPFLEFYLARKEKELERTYEEIKRKEGTNPINEFPQIIEGLIRNYQELVKVLDLKSEKSKEVKKLFTKIISDLQKEKSKSQQGESNSNGEHTAITMSNAERIKQFVQSFQANWKETERITTNLIQELEKEQVETQIQISPKQN